MTHRIGCLLWWSEKSTIHSVHTLLQLTLANCVWSANEPKATMKTSHFSSVVVGAVIYMMTSNLI